MRIYISIYSNCSIYYAFSESKPDRSNLLFDSNSTLSSSAICSILECIIRITSLNYFKASFRLPSEQYTDPRLYFGKRSNKFSLCLLRPTESC